MRHKLSAYSSVPSENIFKKDKIEVLGITIVWQTVGVRVDLFLID